MIIEESPKRALEKAKYFDIAYFDTNLATSHLGGAHKRRAREYLYQMVKRDDALHTTVDVCDEMLSNYAMNRTLADYIALIESGERCHKLNRFGSTTKLVYELHRRGRIHYLPEAFVDSPIIQDGISSFEEKGIHRTDTLLTLQAYATQKQHPDKHVVLISADRDVRHVYETISHNVPTLPKPELIWVNKWAYQRELTY